MSSVSLNRSADPYRADEKSGSLPGGFLKENVESRDESKSEASEVSKMSTETKVLIGLGVILGLGALVGLGGVAWHYGAVAHISVAGHALPAPSTATWISMAAAGGGTAVVAGGAIAGIKIRDAVNTSKARKREEETRERGISKVLAEEREAGAKEVKKAAEAKAERTKARAERRAARVERKRLDKKRKLDDLTIERYLERFAEGKVSNLKDLKKEIETEKKAEKMERKART